MMNAVQRKIAQLKGRLIASLVGDSELHAPASIGNQVDAARITAAVSMAEQGSVGELWSIYDSVLAGDLWVQAMLDARKLATLNDTITAVPDDPDRPEDTEAAEAVNGAIRGVLRFRLGCLNALMDGVLYPVSVVEKRYAPDLARPGQYRLVELKRVPHWLEDYRTGSLRIRAQDGAGRAMDSTYDVEPARHIVHRGSMLTMPDQWGGPFRSVLFLWLIKTCNREWWARSLERWGAPIPVGKYPRGDTQAKAALKLAFSQYLRLGGIVTSDNASVELIAGASTGNGEAFAKLQAWAEGQIQIRILGQTLSAQASPTGLGSGVADLQGEVRDDITLMDQMALGETLTDGLARPHLAVMGLPGQCSVRVGSGTDLNQAQTLAGVLASLATAGVEVDDDAIAALSDLMGLSLRRRDPMAPLPIQALSAAIRRARDPDEARSAIVETLSGQA